MSIAKRTQTLSSGGPYQVLAKAQALENLVRISETFLCEFVREHRNGVG